MISWCFSYMHPKASELTHLNVYRADAASVKVRAGRAGIPDEIDEHLHAPCHGPGRLMTMRRAIRCPRSVILGAAVLAVWSSSVPAQDIERGRQFSLRACSVCHQVSPRLPAGVPPAPPFASIAASKQFRAKHAKLLWEAHGTMPNFSLTADEAADVAAYIGSLAKTGPVRK
jgi:hypothetical protein